MNKPESSVQKPETPEEADTAVPRPQDLARKLPKEIGGPAGPEPTRYGDWEQKGRCTDF
jgi:hypothetical protein